jgi:hypothetical protein
MKNSSKTTKYLSSNLRKHFEKIKTLSHRFFKNCASKVTLFKLQNKSIPSNKLISRKDLVRELNVPRTTLAQWGKKGLLPPSFKHNYSVYYRAADLEKFITNQTKK